MKKKSMAKKVFKGIGIVLLICVLLFLLLLAFLTITEYRPKQKISLHVNGTASWQSVKRGEHLRLATWNIGYGALGDNADFFMDGGSHVKTASRARVQQNLRGQKEALQGMDPDFVFLQEADRNSSRSYHINEVKSIADAFPEDQNTFAQNFRVAFIPYPVPPIGKVDGGIVTLSDRTVQSSTRIQLPCPFKWPVRLGNLKRCLMVNRVKVKGTDHQLVLVNLHLEAYDSGSGKAAQTKALKKVLDREYKKGNYVVAAGDFNQTFSNVDSSLYPALKGTWHAGSISVDSFGKDWQFLMDSSVPTCRSLDKPLKGHTDGNFQYYMIDGFIVSPNVRVLETETQDLGFRNSDHNPVLLQFALK